GVVARQFVEDHPGEGVTKVIQVCAPNGGSSWARWATARKNQRGVLPPLPKEERQRALPGRQGRRIPGGAGAGGGAGGGRRGRRGKGGAGDVVAQGVRA